LAFIDTIGAELSMLFLQKTVPVLDKITMPHN